MKRDKLVVALLLGTAGALAAQAPPSDEASKLVIELSEAVLSTYEAGDWERLHAYFAVDLRQAGTAETIKAKVEALEQVLGRPELILLFETESESDGCVLQRYAVRFEEGLGQLELRLCLREGIIDLRTLSLIPDTIFLAEYILTDLLPQQSEVEMMFAHCGQDGVPETTGEMSCVGITTAGETLAFVMQVAGPGQVEIVDATVIAESSLEPTQEVLEPVARKFLERYNHQAARKIRDDASPGFQASVDLTRLEQSLDDLHQVLGRTRQIAWGSQDSDSRDGLPIVRMEVEFEKFAGAVLIKPVPFNGGWALHRFKMVFPEGSNADRALTQKGLLRLAQQLTLDPNATLECPVEEFDRPGSSVTCRITTRGRTVTGEAHRAEDRLFLGENEITLNISDLQIGLGRWLAELNRPLGWEVRELTCDEVALFPGKETSCVARHDHGSTRFLVRASQDGRVRIVTAEDLQ